MICPNCHNALSSSASLCDCGWINNDSVKGTNIEDFDYETPAKTKEHIIWIVAIVIALSVPIIGSFVGYFIIEESSHITYRTYRDSEEIFVGLAVASLIIWGMIGAAIG